MQFWDWYTIQYTVISKGHYYISATYRNWFLADNVCIDKKATRFCSLKAFEIHILLKSFLLCHTPRNCSRFPTAEYTTHTHTRTPSVYMYRRCTVCTVRWFTSEPVSRHLYQAWSFHESLKLPSKNLTHADSHSSRLGWNFYKTCFINSRIVKRFCWYLKL